jgi:EAL domain-containing protein (putative c-di-GMP-specific phosphodiesterase class I)
MEEKNELLLQNRKYTPSKEEKYLNEPNNDTFLRQSVDKIIEQRTLKVVYQPIVNHSLGVIFAFEALSRPHYQGSFIPPDVWFRAAYESDRSIEADLLALTASVCSLKSLPHKIQSFPLFVNVMPSSLFEETFVEGLEVLLREGLCEPQQLVLEFVEYVSYDPSLLSKMLRPIRSLGVRIALDDVGIGNTNLAALVHVEPDFIKVDRSLIQGISTSSAKQRLLSLLVGFMESGDSVIAEGIENPEDLAAVREAGANVSQGYYWARPMSFENLSDLIAEIETKKKTLLKLVQDNDGSLTDDAVAQKSQELDSLINLYHRLRNEL